MFILNLLIGNTFLVLLLTLLMLLIIFYAIGRIIQYFFSFRKSNMIIAIPIGFFSYLVITEIFYTISIFFGFAGEDLFFRNKERRPIFNL
ncbi:MAG: hypothetical protein HRS50_01390 [Mycoplasmataceae bacterium]|nr:hypothetical protein [Mycoplasmataceae bacterium]